ncbi:TPA: hypothetical protein ACGSA7_000056 [Escherichia coli]
MKSMAKILIVAALAGITFNANAERSPEAKYILSECALHAQLYDIERGSGDGELEMPFNVGCIHYAMKPVLEKTDKWKELDSKYSGLKEAKKNNKAILRAFEDGESYGANVSHRVDAFFH